MTGLRYEDFWTHQDFGWGTKKAPKDSAGKSRGDYRIILLTMFKSKALLRRVKEIAADHATHFVTQSDL